MNTVTSILQWLAGSAALPRWAVCVGALCTFTVLSTIAFTWWFTRFSEDTQRETEHD